MHLEARPGSGGRRIRWYFHRLVRMSPSEVGDRLIDAWWKWRWRNRQVKDWERDPLVIPSRTHLFSSSLGESLLDDIADQQRQRILDAADEAINGRFPFFDRLFEGLTEAPDWFLDRRTGRRAPAQSYAFDIDHRRVETVGTVKYVWEPSRHQQLTVVALAFFVSRDERYARFVRAQLTSWWRSNPFLSGIHWTSGIELGVRLISWVWIRRLLHAWPEAGALFEENTTFLRQLHHHQEWLARFPSHGSSANNHLLAELSGQFAACSAFPYFTESTSWREQAAARLALEVRRQTFPGGLNRELATGYQVFVLELLFAALVEGEAAGQGLAPEVWSEACRMCDALAAVLDEAGRPPRQGDSDEGRGVLLDCPQADPVSSLLSTGGEFFGSLAWWPSVDRSDVRTRLWKALASPPRAPGSRPTRRPSLFAEAGMVILRGRTDTGEIWCRCDHGPHGFLSIAAHGHADALSVELRIGGIDVLADPGTYTYQGEDEWRAYFRSTIGHNCLVIRDQSQSIPAGPFNWRHVARSSLLEVTGLDEGPLAVWKATHDGYKRLRPGARHERSVRLARSEGIVRITDIVHSTAPQPCALAFHLGPTVTCDLEGSVAKLHWPNGHQRHAASLHLPAGLAWRTYHGAEDPPLGWYSPCFGSKIPSTTLVGEGTVAPGSNLETTVLIDPA